MTTLLILLSPPVFEQGQQGDTWYVILRGSVDVVVNGVKVCALHEGDGFGELAVISKDPRYKLIPMDVCVCVCIKVMF